MKSEWYSNLRLEILAGITVALALIPEAIAFSIIAGVDPMVGLYAAFCIAVTIAFVGGRPGMISGATGAMALLMITLVAEHGLEYLLAATVLTGIIQMVAGALKLGRFMSFIPHSVMLGFVNALAILIFLAQVPHFVGHGWVVYGLLAATLVIIYGLPRLTKAVPSALVAIVVITAVAIFGGLGVNTVGDMGAITRELPVFALPDIELSLQTLMIILPYSLTLALVGMLESLMTASIVDEMTETKSDKNKELRGQGIANTITGCFGGMAGCAMIGQSVINVKSGGRGRLSSLVAGVFLMFLILVLGDIVTQIPMAALVGVMIMVSVGTFDWQSLRDLRRVPLGDSVVMVSTVAVTVYTHDLAMGVGVGVILSAIIFGWRIAKIEVEDEIRPSGVKHYRVRGQLFFASTDRFMENFEVSDDPDEVVIDFGGSHIWDHSAVTAIARLNAKYRAAGKEIRLEGLNRASQELIDTIGLKSTSGH